MVAVVCAGLCSGTYDGMWWYVVVWFICVGMRWYVYAVVCGGICGVMHRHAVVCDGKSQHTCSKRDVNMYVFTACST